MPSLSSRLSECRRLFITLPLRPASVDSSLFRRHLRANVEMVRHRYGGTFRVEFIEDGVDFTTLLWRVEHGGFTQAEELAFYETVIEMFH